MAILRLRQQRENYIFLLISAFSGMHPPRCGKDVRAMRGILQDLHDQLRANIDLLRPRNGNRVNW